MSVQHHTPSHSPSHKSPNQSKATRPFALVWLRRELRLHDNPALIEALEWLNRKGGGGLALVWVWPKEREGKDPFDQPRTSPHLAHLWQGSALELKARVASLGGVMLTLKGSPSTLIPELCTRLQASRVFAHEAHTYDEVCEEQRVGQALAERGVPLSLYEGCTLFERAQLPFALKELPGVFSTFRRAIERGSGRYQEGCEPPHPLASPHTFPLLTPEERARLEDQALFEGITGANALTEAHAQPPFDTRSALLCAPGEEAALARLHDYLWGRDLVTTYKETRNGLIGEGYSTKLSPWLSCGALSAREVWWAVKRYERERTENDSTYWVRFELLWREFFQWYALRWGPHLFQARGVKGAEQGLTPKRLTHNPLSKREQEALKRWREGQTGEPFVDANMRELRATGWMSNRGRQNVASYLIHDLKLDWRAGAGAFEGMLIDDDAASNWGNWAYIAGVGSDPRPLRAFNVRGQAKRYDPEGAYRALWLKES